MSCFVLRAEPYQVIFRFRNSPLSRFLASSRPFRPVLPRRLYQSHSRFTNSALFALSAGFSSCFSALSIRTLAECFSPSQFGAYRAFPLKFETLSPQSWRTLSDPAFNTNSANSHRIRIKSNTHTNTAMTIRCESDLALLRILRPAARTPWIERCSKSGGGRSGAGSPPEDSRLLPAAPWRLGEHYTHPDAVSNRQSNFFRAMFWPPL